MINWFEVNVELLNPMTERTRGRATFFSSLPSIYVPEMLGVGCKDFTHPFIAFAYANDSSGFKNQKVSVGKLLSVKIDSRVKRILEIAPTPHFFRQLSYNGKKFSAEELFKAMESNSDVRCLSGVESDNLRMIFHCVHDMLDKALRHSNVEVLEAFRLRSNQSHLHVG